MGLGDGELAWPVSAPGSSLSIRGEKKKKKERIREMGREEAKNTLSAKICQLSTFCGNCHMFGLLWTALSPGHMSL